MLCWDLECLTVDACPARALPNWRTYLQAENVEDKEMVCPTFGTSEGPDDANVTKIDTSYNDLIQQVPVF